METIKVTKQLSLRCSALRRSLCQGLLPLLPLAPHWPAGLSITGDLPYLGHTQPWEELSNPELGLQPEQPFPQCPPAAPPGRLHNVLTARDQRGRPGPHRTPVTPGASSQRPAQHPVLQKDWTFRPAAEGCVRLGRAEEEGEHLRGGSRHALCPAWRRRGRAGLIDRRRGEARFVNRNLRARTN